MFILSIFSDIHLLSTISWVCIPPARSRPLFSTINWTTWIVPRNSRCRNQFLLVQCRGFMQNQSSSASKSSSHLKHFPSSKNHNWTRSTSTTQPIPYLLSFWSTCPVGIANLLLKYIKNLARRHKRYFQMSRAFKSASIPRDKCAKCLSVAHLSPSNAWHVTKTRTRLHRKAFCTARPAA